MSTPTAEQILKKHYDKLKTDFPDEDILDWDLEFPDIQMTLAAMKEYASSVGGKNWVCGGKRLPEDDSYEDFPEQYVVRIKGDDPRSGWVAASIMTAEEMRKGVSDDYWEWLSPTPILQKEDGWIPVDKELPPKTDKFYYWLYFEFNDSYEQGEYNYGTRCFVDKVGEMLVRVSHWQKPSPPTTVNNRQ